VACADARDGLYWVGGASGAAVSVGALVDRQFAVQPHAVALSRAGVKRGCIFGLIPEGSSVSWCRLSAAELMSCVDQDAAARAGKLTLSRSTLCRSTDPVYQDGRMALRFLTASTRLAQPSQKLHFSATGMRSTDTPLLLDAAPAGERLPDSNGMPCRVWFHYLYHRNMRRRTETTERSACSICSLACCSFQGLQEHLLATHPGFIFSFSDPARCEHPSFAQSKHSLTCAYRSPQCHSNGQRQLHARRRPACCTN